MEEIGLQDVFVTSGVPIYTFVQPKEYNRLILSLKTCGRGIVIEGPSGIGKTTAVLKAIEEIGLSAKVTLLSARKASDREIINNLPSLMPFDVIIVDDFQRLDANEKKSLSDLLKIMADESISHSKLIVIGINQAGQSLIDCGRDLATRIDIIQFEANDNEQVKSLITKGEHILNIEIPFKDAIVNAAHGSFYIAQMLSQKSCLADNVLASRKEKKVLNISFEKVKEIATRELARKFHRDILLFARGPKLRREGRAPYFHIVKWLAQSNQFSINLELYADHYPEQKAGVSQLLLKGFLAKYIAENENLQNLFALSDSILAIQDPQLSFYLNCIDWDELFVEVGYVKKAENAAYDFALSFAGEDRLIAEMLFSKLTERETVVFYDKDKQHEILGADIEEYLTPIYESNARFIICILGTKYPEKIWTQFEADHFKSRIPQRQVIPILVNSFRLSPFDSIEKIGRYDIDSTKGDLSNQLDTLADLLVKKL